MKLKWQQAPVKTEWGQGMVVASVAIDNDHTLDLYCERDQTQKVETMLTRRTWVGLTEDEISKLVYSCDYDEYEELVRATEAKLKERNT